MKQTKRKKKRKGGLSLAGLTVLGLLCVAMILVDLYLYMSADAGSRSTTALQTETEEESSAPVVSQLPQIIAVSPTETEDTVPAQDETPEAEAEDQTIDGRAWENDWVSFSYDEATMWVIEDGGVISVTDLELSALPRLDIQQVENAEDLSETEFRSLAGAAVRAYYAVEPPRDAVTVEMLSAQGGWYAELPVEETEAAPAMWAWVRLENGVLTTMLLDQTTDADTETLWLSLLDSVAG